MKRFIILTAFLMFLVSPTRADNTAPVSCYEPDGRDVVWDPVPNLNVTISVGDFDGVPSDGTDDWERGFGYVVMERCTKTGDRRPVGDGEVIDSELAPITVFEDDEFDINTAGVYHFTALWYLTGHSESEEVSFTVTVEETPTLTLSIEEDHTDCMEGRSMTYTITLPNPDADTNNITLNLNSDDGPQNLAPGDIEWGDDGVGTVDFQVPNVPGDGTNYTISAVVQDADGNDIGDTKTLKVWKFKIDFFGTGSPNGGTNKSDYYVAGGSGASITHLKHTGSPHCKNWTFVVKKNGSDSHWSMEKEGGFIHRAEQDTHDYWYLTCKIPGSELKDAELFEDFGAGYDIVVNCEDFEGNSHSLTRSGGKVFFDADLGIDGTNSITSDNPPCWYKFWRGTEVFSDDVGFDSSVSSGQVNINYAFGSPLVVGVYKPVLGIDANNGGSYGKMSYRSGEKIVKYSNYEPYLEERNCITVDRVSTTHVDGIDSVYITARHEWLHYENISFHNLDADQDGINDADEVTAIVNNTIDDSKSVQEVANSHQVDVDSPNVDGEYFAYKAEYHFGNGPGTFDLDKFKDLDWSFMGKNW